MNWEDSPEIDFLPEENKTKIRDIFDKIDEFNLFPPERIAEMDEALLWNI